MNEMKQQLSAFMDGEVDLDANPHLVKTTLQNEELIHSWATYHLIGDILRGDHALKRDVTALTMQHLKGEPVVLAPKRRITQWISHQYATSMAASVAAVAFVGWAVWQARGLGVQQPVMQASATPSPVTQQIAAKNSPPAETFDRYMLAHHEYASGNAMQYSADIQTASYSEAGN
jgi:sigma-E factor negative regulatory protein RseA